MTHDLIMLLLAGAAPSPMAPMEFLIGHCWLGKPKPNQTDRHCFRRAADGSIRDHNDVSEDGKLKGSGDTIYRWNASAGQIEYTYRDSLGGVQSSSVKPSGSVLDFGTAPYRTKDGKSYPIRSRWTVLGPASYKTEVSTPLMPFVKRTTTYNRVD